MSSKRVISLTKDRCLPLKSNQFCGNNASKGLNNNNNGQFNSINLNKNNEFEKIKFDQPKSTSFLKKSQNNNGFFDYKSGSKNALNDWKKNDTPNFHESLKTQEMKKEWENKVKKDCNKSTLSLHIEADENSNEAKNFTFACGTLYDFPKQQNKKSMNPETMQFKTSQKLSNFATTQIVTQRTAHTDVQFPNFDSYRHDSTKDPSQPARATEDDRRAIPSAALYGVGGMLTLYAGKEVVQTLVTYKAMAADQRALAAIEIKLADVPEGQTKTFEWRGKPVFVKHRTAQEIKREKSVNVSDLRHPEHDDQRVQKDEWSVVIGVCTHLGCVPIANAGDFGGYYCPCHGSHYDGSGRIRKGPAPLNLHVPAYTFKDDVIVIGSS